MPPVVDLSGNWQMKQSNGFYVDVSMNQDGPTLNAFCSHSGGRVRSTEATGTANGDSFILVITWGDGSKGEYTGRLETGFFTNASEGILKGNTRDLNNSDSTATWEVMDRVFTRP